MSWKSYGITIGISAAVFAVLGGIGWAETGPFAVVPAAVGAAYGAIIGSLGYVTFFGAAIAVQFLLRPSGNCPDETLVKEYGAYANEIWEDPNASGQSWYELNVDAGIHADYSDCTLNKVGVDYANRFICPTHDQVAKSKNPWAWDRGVGADKDTCKGPCSPKGPCNVFPIPYVCPTGKDVCTAGGDKEAIWQAKADQCLWMRNGGCPWPDGCEGAPSCFRPKVMYIPMEAAFPKA